MDMTKVEETRGSDGVFEESDECPPGLMYIKQEATSHSPSPRCTAETESLRNTRTSSFSPAVRMPRLHNHVEPPARRPSTSVLEHCRENLVPVMRAAATARGPNSRSLENITHAQQCTTFRLSDDQCETLLCLAKDMRGQLHHMPAREQRADRRETAEHRGRRNNLGSRPDRLTPWSRRDLPARHESVDGTGTPLRRDSDMTLVDVPNSKDVSSVVCALQNGFVGAEKIYDSLSKEERMSSVLPTTGVLNNDIADRPESIFKYLDLEEIGACPPIPEVQPLTVPGIWSRYNGSDMPDVHNVEIIVGEDLFSPETGR